MRIVSIAASALALASLSPAGAAAPVASLARQDAELARFFQDYDRAQLALSPRGKASRGIIDADYDRWEDFSDAQAQQAHALDLAALKALRQRFDRSRLSPEDRLSYDLFENMIARSSDVFTFRKNGYVFDHRFGLHSTLPAFLMNVHRVSDVATAQAYVSRLAKLGPALDQLMTEARQRAEAGVLQPKWVQPYIIKSARNVISGAPFDQAADSPLYADLKKKIDPLPLPETEKARLIAEGRAALLENVGPAYLRLIALMEEQHAAAPEEDGIWRLPRGQAYYAERLRFHTTTDLTADQIHALGLEETARIHGEMRAIMRKVGFVGDLKQFFEHLRTEDRYYHSSREAYLAEVEAHRANVEAQLPRFFNRLPKAKFEVRPVEAFREASAGSAFYQLPAPDGSRPGVYFVNFRNMRAQPKYELEALFYHEGLPGHHLQLGLQAELGDLPPFRQFGGVTAYSEGWGLYAEMLAKEMGFYSDPYSDFGRLGMELLRSTRLVVDTGIHQKRWSRAQAIAYLKENTPFASDEIERSVERYITYPGQANAYLIGKLKIMELRDKARRQLGSRFDIRGFHDAVLLSGPVPLDILERNLDSWVAAQSRREIASK